MFGKIAFYDNLAKHFFSPWWMYLLLGLNFVLIAALIFIFPELLAYLIAFFLLLNGLLLIVLAFQVRRLKKSYEQWRTLYLIEEEL